MGDLLHLGRDPATGLCGGRMEERTCRVAGPQGAVLAVVPYLVCMRCGVTRPVDTIETLTAAEARKGGNFLGLRRPSLVVVRPQAVEV